MFQNLFIIQLIQLKNAQKTYQMKDVDHVYLLIEIFFQISFENVEKSEVERPIVQRGGQM